MQKAECAKNDEMGNCSVYLMLSLDFLYFNNESLWKASVFIEFIWDGVIRKRVDIRRAVKCRLDTGIVINS